MKVGLEIPRSNRMGKMPTRYPLAADQMFGTLLVMANLTQRSNSSGTVFVRLHDASSG